VIRRLFALILVGWALGFALFVILLPRPADLTKTDAIVVPTGAQGRIARGMDIIGKGRARRMLITGVDRRVKPVELAEAQQVSLKIMACCVDLGREASDTRSNGDETAAWIRRNKYQSVRLVTSDWHMRRARFELERALGTGVVIIPDALRSDASLGVLLREYNKYLFRRAAVLIGL
jgi:uncharacterized SAM-binding protein YcdF (DUF218 family)